MAEKAGNCDQVVVACSSCYLNLKKVEIQIKQDPELHMRLNSVLEAEGLCLTGGIRVKHLLEVLSKEIPLEQIKRITQKPLGNLSIAPYYGCQCLRPYPVFDNPEFPMTMVPILETIGAKVHQWNMGARCCGASQMTLKSDTAIRYVTDILRAAQGADAIVTVCPMCQMNLEAYQNQANRYADQNLNISILYLPQLLGIAFGLSREKIGISFNLSMLKGLKQNLAV